MARIFSSISELIGSTPLLRLHRLEQAHHLRARHLLKRESRNPAGSSQARVALSMLDKAREQGLLPPGGTIIEPTSGNTGIGLAAVAASRGYRCIIVMPDSMSPERRRIMAALGAQVVLTPGAQGMTGAIARAEQLARENPGSFLAGQFTNPANPEAHYRTTGPEIWRDTDGDLDIFVAGIGTGGTITGVGRYLKEQNPSIRFVGVEPWDSPVLTQGRSGAHGIQGIGAGFLPDTLDVSLLDRVLPVTTADAMAAGRSLGQEEGILAGISGGAALWAALELAKMPENTGKTIVTLLPDSGERYLSTTMYAE